MSSIKYAYYVVLGCLIEFDTQEIWDRVTKIAQEYGCSIIHGGVVYFLNKSKAEEFMDDPRIIHPIKVLNFNLIEYTGDSFESHFNEFKYEINEAINDFL